MDTVGYEGKYGRTPHLAMINFLVCAIIFTESIKFGQTAIGEIKLQYFITYPMLLVLCFFLRGIYLDVRFVLCIIALTAATYWNVLIGKNESILMFKVCFGIFQNALIFYMLVKLNDFKVMPLFRVYMALCVPVALFGLAQEAGYLLGLEAIYNLSWLIPGYGVAQTAGALIRIRSVLPEPSYLVFSLLPAVFAAVHSLFDPKNRIVNPIQGIIILTTLVFALSTLGYISFGISLIVILINFRKVRHLAVISVLLPVLAVLAYTAVPDVKVRVDGTIGMVTGELDVEEVDLSNFALFSNLQVAILSFQENPWIGSGLGSHKVSYTRHIGNVIDVEKTRSFLNIEDGGSMMLRLISETGILGTGLFLIFLFRCRLPKSKDPTGRLWIVNNAVFVLLILKLIRFGNYFELGTFLFFWILYATKREAMEQRAHEGEGLALAPAT